MFWLGNASKNSLIDEVGENRYYEPGDEKVKITDKNNTRAIIANAVKIGGVCLDVGCGAGGVGYVLHKYRKAKVYGIDLDKTALEYAKKTKGYVGLYNFSIVDRKGEEYKRFIDDNHKFDYVIFADVVEHVTKPEDLLIFFANFLKPGGKILISLPNIAHFDIVRGLINGNFNYNKVGLLDNTHLRFYTDRSFKQFIQQLNEVFDRNFSIKNIGRTVVQPEYLGKYMAVYEKMSINGQVCVLQNVYEISTDSTKGEVVIPRGKDVLLEIEKVLEEEKRTKIEFMETKENMQVRINELEEMVRAMLNSTSWKMTAPIRKITGVVKRTKR